MGNGRPGPQRWLDVGPERIEAWLASFTARHGQTELTIDDRREIVMARAADGSSAECHAPFPPLAARLRGTAVSNAANLLVSTSYRWSARRPDPLRRVTPRADDYRDSNEEC